MDEDERERIRREALEEASLLERLRALERDHIEMRALVRAVADLTMEKNELQRGLKEALDYKRMLDTYKSRLAWVIVLGAAALILRPLVNMWDKVLSIFGMHG